MHHGELGGVRFSGNLENVKANLLCVVAGRSHAERAYVLVQRKPFEPETYRSVYLEIIEYKYYAGPPPPTIA
jgi:hypothetical protein